MELDISLEVNKMSLSKKLTLSFVFSIIISILIISFISNTMINNKFNLYLIEEQNKKFETIRNDINDLFLEKDGDLENQDLSNYAFREGIYLEIKDNENNIISYSNNNNKSHKNNKEHNINHRGMMNKEFNKGMGNYVEKTFPLLDENKTIGTLVIGYIDNSHLTASALVFKNTLFRSFSISGIITIIIGFFISMFLSNSLTNPLISITNTANQIRNGHLKSRSNVKTNTNEILELSHSINYLAETLESQENLRKKYASDIAHELRTPLTTLKSHVEAIMDGVWKPNDEHLTILMNEIDRLTKLVEDLKDSFKTSESQLNLNKTKFNISNEIKSISSEFQPLFNKEHYILKLSIEENIQISMDKDKLKQIIYNLLSNSMKYLNNNGEVIIRLIKEEKYAKIIIEDNGTGIKEKDLPFIFERFYRSDISRNKETGGTGLGLSITKTLVEAHDGSIYVESLFDKGSKFIVLLPIDGDS